MHSRRSRTTTFEVPLLEQLGFHKSFGELVKRKESSGAPCRLYFCFYNTVVVCCSLLTITVYGYRLSARRPSSNRALKRAQGRGSSEIERRSTVRPLPPSRSIRLIKNLEALRLITPCFCLIWSFAPKIRSVDGIYTSTDYIRLYFHHAHFIPLVAWEKRGAF